MMGRIVAPFPIARHCLFLTRIASDARCQPGFSPCLPTPLDFLLRFGYIHSKQVQYASKSSGSPIKADRGGRHE
ncbi:MAG: hypothetical protein ACJ8HI_00595, partial [Massilia sp.]